MNTPIHYSALIERLHESDLDGWADRLPEQIRAGLSTQRFGDLSAWYEALDAMPDVTAKYLDLKNSVSIGLKNELSTTQLAQLESSLRKLIPWRKGPFEVFGIHIDTEWRSDWKWQRLSHHIAPLTQRRVLDVGCGNGYHCWRMYGAGAQEVIGIDPSPRFVVQFYMLKKILGEVPVDVLPLGIEQLPPGLACFDTTFSMGVLYHRRSPMDHLLELRDTLRPGGELVLETLIIEGHEGASLVPQGRYGKMNNVWFIPSVPTLISWLQKCGFENVRCIDTSHTTQEEQRSTDWMRFQSLVDFLDPQNPANTVEGHPAPIRAVILANKAL